MSDGQTGTPSSPSSVHITRLKLNDFRNYDTLSLDLDPGPVVLTGENGAGKTNLLEAVSFLSPGRGLRRALLGDVARSGSRQGFAIHAQLDGRFGVCEIGTGTIGTTVDSESTSRRIRINNEPAKSSEDLLEWLRVMWVTPAMDSLFTGSSADRRRFLDRMVLAIDSAHARRTRDYERSMRARNRSLAQDSGDAAWFDAIETQMAETGVAIAAARSEMIRLLTAMYKKLAPEGPFPGAQVTLSGAIDASLADTAAVDVEEAFRTDLKRHRARDRVAGRTLEGPHRSELVVHHVTKKMPAAQCSTGEQKALLMGIVLAHARLTAELSGQAPIMLLDEISAHFDAERRAALFAILEELNCQAFMTGTEPVLFEALKGRAQFLTIASGAVVAEAGSP